MKKAKAIAKKLLYPPVPLLILAPPFVFGALIFIFLNGLDRSAAAYPVYCLSAYCLTILAVRVPQLVRKAIASFKGSSLLEKLNSSPFWSRYLTDLSFRGSVSIYQGMILNFLYVIFRVAVGIIHTSVWFISMAVYYLVLAALRLFLIAGSSRGKDEVKCYRVTAWLLFLLNIPMGGMIVLMVLTNSGYSYPGYVIYLSAMYTFFAMIQSVRNLVKFRRLGSPVLSAAKVLNFVSAMMSMLGLQTAMIARFSTEDDSFRMTMNAITGGAIWGIVIVTAIYMLIHTKSKERGDLSEQIGK